jgi:hypothetical protein
MALKEVHKRLAMLDSNLNAHAAARYDLQEARHALQLFAHDGEYAALVLARERFRRMLKMLAMDDREPLAREVARIVGAAEALSQPERGELASELDRRYGPAKSRIGSEVGKGTVLDDEIALIRRVMKGLPEGLKHWTWEAKTRRRRNEGRFWYIENERHVQNLLWLALAPALPGLKREQQLPSVGGLKSRIDLALPERQLAIETKFMRRPTEWKKLLRQIGEDATFYTEVHNSPYSRLMVLIWDDSRSTGCHPKLLDGLNMLRCVLDAVVVSRPDHMSSREATTPLVPPS